MSRSKHASGGWPKWRSGANRQIGATQEALLRRIAATPSHQTIINPKNNAEWCAAKRLHQRGLLERHQFGSDAIGYVTIHQITKMGLAKLAEYDAAANS